MKHSILRSSVVSLSALVALLLISVSPVIAADGKKWDGKKYPFKLLDPTKNNSESNPFIIDTAGKLAYFAWLAKGNQDLDAFGKQNGLKGLTWSFKGNFVKLTADLDMNGSRFEFIPITSTWVSFDGGGHVIDNLRITDKTTEPVFDDMEGTAEISLALFQSASTIKNLGIGKRSAIIFNSIRKDYLYKVYAAAIAVEVDVMYNCFSDATITVKGKGDTEVGGIAVGGNWISNSYNRGPIVFEGNILDARALNRQKITRPGSLVVGGVCAKPHKKISGCYNTGSITVKASGEDLSIGGVAGMQADEHSISESADLYNAGKVTLTATGDIKNAYIGGMLGYGVTFPKFVGKPKNAETGYIYNKGTIDVTVRTGTSIHVGGIIGGNILGRDFGESYRWEGISGCVNTYNTGSISASSTGKVDSLDVGGIAGYGSMVVNSYNAGRISGTSGAGTTLNLGGLGGKDVYVQNSYNIGEVSGKGSGTNVVGGIMGNASLAWGETDSTRYAALNGFWLKQPQAGGINNDVKYAKGSYFYKKSGDIKKKETNFGKILKIFDNEKEDPNKMVEGLYGAVYSFDSPTATVMTRSDDGPGKRANLKGKLLDNLNGMVEDKIDRMYRKWVIDGTNGGYPVLSSQPASFGNTDEKPDASAAMQIAGEYLGEHKQWTDNVRLNADGTFKRANGGDGGTWTYNGKRLILKWSKWAPEILEQKSAGVFSSNIYGFKLTRSNASTSAEKPDTTTAKKIAGVYHAQHRYWTDNIIINADGTFKCATRGGESGTWSFDGKKLILRWSKWAPEILLQKSEGVFSSSIYRFTLTRSGTSASDTFTTADKPVSATAKKIAGMYHAQHKDWTGNIMINADGTFKRDSNGDGGTWTFDGRKLVLKWYKSAPETLMTSATGFYCPAYKFTLRR
jgi:hypothetical protein